MCTGMDTAEGGEGRVRDWDTVGRHHPVARMHAVWWVAVQLDSAARPDAAGTMDGAHLSSLDREMRDGDPDSRAKTAGACEDGRSG